VGKDKSRLSKRKKVQKWGKHANETERPSLLGVGLGGKKRKGKNRMAKLNRKNQKKAEREKKVASRIGGSRELKRG